MELRKLNKDESEKLNLEIAEFRIHDIFEERNR